MYRCHPLDARARVAHLRGGEIGDDAARARGLRLSLPRDPEGRLFAHRARRRGILDVGGYPVSFARLIAGVVEGGKFAEPTKITGNGVIGPHGADETATALLTFKSGFTAVVTAAVYHPAGTSAIVFGDKGHIVLPDPVDSAERSAGARDGYTIYRDGQAPETVSIKTEMATYAIEAELVADTLPATEAAWPAMSWDETVGTMRVLDAWLAAIHA